MALQLASSPLTYGFSTYGWMDSQSSAVSLKRTKMYLAHITNHEWMRMT